jgi:tetratricopeptide (TPR) repeat protein
VRLRPSAASVEPATDYPELIEVDPAHYVLVREIARGGMGRIHIARDRRLGREVAIKEVLIDSESARRRFEREARITAGLQHPSIVSVHEAGHWPSGDPFYAMRLVTGRVLDEVIAEATTFAERIALVPNVLAVADAMAYAHGQRVIHRDLKPRNIVVAGFGETVVLDWGIAKRLESDRASTPRATDVGNQPETESIAGETSIGDVLGTPAYMPPEQAAGTAVDERADVYAIGAILYHVLAGRPPYVGTSNAELIAALMTEPLEPLASRVPGVPEELAAIVNRAMARDVEQRYRTAAELADDLRRFQTGQLVGAHRYSLRELLRRWARRYRTPLIAGGVALLVAIGIGVFALQRIFAADREIEHQRGVALSNQASAEELMQFFVGDLHQKLIDLGRLDLLGTVARRAAAYYDARGAGESEKDFALMASARAGIGNVLSKEGDLPAAHIELEKARVAYEQLIARYPQTSRYRLELAPVFVDLGDVAVAQGDSTKALGFARDAVMTGETALAMGMATERDAARHWVVRGRRLTVEIFELRGDNAAALAEARTALGVANAEQDPARAPKDQLGLHSTVGRLIYKTSNDIDAALVESRAGLAIGVEWMAKQPMTANWRYDVALSHSEIANRLLQRHDVAGALVELRAATPMLDRLVELEPSNTVWTDARASSYEKLGLAHLARHDYTAARAAFQTSVAGRSALAKRDLTNMEWQYDASLSTIQLADVDFATHDVAVALAAYQDALAIRQQLVAKDPTNRTWQRAVFYSHYKIASAELELGQNSQALDELRITEQLAMTALAHDPTNADAKSDLEGTRDEIGDTLVKLHDKIGARAAYEAALEIEHDLAKQPHQSEDALKQIGLLETKLAKLK